MGEDTSTSERDPNSCMPGVYPNHPSVDWSQEKLVRRTFQPAFVGQIFPEAKQANQFGLSHTVKLFYKNVLSSCCCPLLVDVQCWYCNLGGSQQLFGNSSSDLVLYNIAVGSVQWQSHSLVFCHQGIAKTKKQFVQQGVSTVMPMTKLYDVSMSKISVALFLTPLDTLVKASFQTAPTSHSGCSCFTLIQPLFSEYTFFAGPCILFHPSNCLNTILNGQLVYQSQLSLRTTLSGVSVKLLDECAY